MTQGDPVDHKIEFVHEQEMLRTTMVEKLMVQAAELATVGHDLVRSAVLTRIQRWVIFICLFLVMLGTVLSVITTLTNRSVNRATNHNTDIIRDCTDPEGKCFQDGQARTAEAVGNINKVVTAASFCARLPENDTLDEVEACVKRALLK